MKRDYPERPIVGVGTVIIDSDRVLLVRRATEPLKGEWSIPGGAVELGETLQDAARREAREETGLAAEPLEVLAVFDSIFVDQRGRVQYHYVLVDYLCRLISGEPGPGTDVSEVKWVHGEQLECLHLRETIKQVVTKGLAAVAGTST